jgi:hypothetical protein
MRRRHSTPDDVLHQPRWQTILACVGVLICVGCTGSQSPPPTPPVSSAPMVSDEPSISSTSERTIELDCADATVPQAGPNQSGTSFGGLAFEAPLNADVEGLMPEDVGLRVPAGVHLYWLKVPVYLAPDTPMTSVSLDAGSGGYLAWVPARIWTGEGGRPLDLTPWMANRVTFNDCPDEGMYLGGVLSDDPGMCLELHIEQKSSGTPYPYRNVRLGGHPRC